MKKVLAVLVAAILASAPAFAAVQNVKVSGDIDSSYINRQNFNFGTRTNGTGVEAGLTDQSVFITQTRLRVDADLSDNVSTTVGLINERAWGAENTTENGDTDVDLYLAYVTLREMLYSPLTVTIGRQVFAYGNGLILGDGGANNVATGALSGIAADFTKRTAYDGVKAVLDYKPLTLDLLYFKNSSGVVTGAAGANDDESDVFGLNANYQLGDAMSTVVEGYFFARVNGDASASTDGDKLYVPGLRVSTNPVAGLNTQAEVAWQTGTKAVTAGGSYANIDREAFAAQFLANYTLPVLEQYKPVVFGSYTFVSGDKNAGINNGTGTGSDETYSAWDQFNEAQGGGTIYNTLFDLTNMQIISAGAQVNPLEDVTAKLTWSSLWADTSYSAQNVLTFRQPDRTSTAMAPNTQLDKEHLGNEYDVNLTYAYTEDVKFGLNLGWFVPGDVFLGTNDTTASQAIANVVVAF